MLYLSWWYKNEVVTRSWKPNAEQERAAQSVGNCPWCWPRCWVLGLPGPEVAAHREGRSQNNKATPTHVCFQVSIPFQGLNWCLKFHPSLQGLTDASNSTLPRKDRNSHLQSSQSLQQAFNLLHLILTTRVDPWRLINLPKMAKLLSRRMILV